MFGLTAYVLTSLVVVYLIKTGESLDEARAACRDHDAAQALPSLPAAPSIIATVTPWPPDSVRGRMLADRERKRRYAQRHGQQHAP